ILIPLFGDTIMKLLMYFFDNIHMLDNSMWLYVLLKTLISFIFMYFVIKFLYTYAPSKEIDKNTTIRGALFTTISWILATNVFSFYVTRIAKYKLLYGNFANILVLMLWIYLLALLFVVGMALNVEDFHKKRGDAKNEKEGKEQE
ncbi:YihY family inner membrane protein, partial [bacterium]|nr:YihY family inner membrane protein [bacterium]